ncbi:hypothetical protein AQZ52_08145 [Novosphingobium fuchskuhlense]|uniref:DUF4402 domain-containing protein n=1 Tax=Novosphingobium fuchskuhlense TaxID=1117702 RepID=A0A117UVZ3_9SPHN|nr:hypothetical protein AQZ52_08145 [Novosphingobium fuchskuhlense]
MRTPEVGALMDNRFTSSKTGTLRGAQQSGALDVKKIILASTIAALGVLATATPAFAGSGNQSTANGTATATIVAPIVLTHPAAASLNFGRFTTGTGGTVTITAAGAGSVGSDVTFVPGSATSADQFTVAGDASRSFSITTTGGNVTSGSTNLAFTTSPSAATAALGTTGTASFTVGGTLTVTGTAPAGSYTGTYSATVTYN